MSTTTESSWLVSLSVQQLKLASFWVRTYLSAWSKCIRPDSVNFGVVLDWISILESLINWKLFYPTHLQKWGGFYPYDLCVVYNNHKVDLELVRNH